MRPPRALVASGRAGPSRPCPASSWLWRPLLDASTVVRQTAARSRQDVVLSVTGRLVGRQPRQQPSSSPGSRSGPRRRSGPLLRLGRARPSLMTCATSCSAGVSTRSTGPADRVPRRHVREQMRPEERPGPPRSELAEPAGGTAEADAFAAQRHRLTRAEGGGADSEVVLRRLQRERPLLVESDRPAGHPRRHRSVAAPRPRSEPTRSYRSVRLDGGGLLPGEVHPRGGLEPDDRWGALESEKCSPEGSIPSGPERWESDQPGVPPRKRKGTASMQSLAAPARSARARSGASASAAAPETGVVAPKLGHGRHCGAPPGGGGISRSEQSHALPVKRRAPARAVRAVREPSEDRAGASGASRPIWSVEPGAAAGGRPGGEWGRSAAGRKALWCAPVTRARTGVPCTRGAGAAARPAMTPGPPRRHVSRKAT